MTSRIGWWASVCLVLSVAAPASAKAPKKDKKDEPAAPSGGLMEDGEKDPAETESGDDSGQFVPGRKSHAGEESDEVDEGKTPAQREAEKEAAKKAEPPKKKHYGNHKTIGVFAEALIGFGKAPVPGPGDTAAGGSTTGDATSFAFLVGGHFDVTPEFRLMLRVPFTVGTVLTDGGNASANALGNPELLARYRLTEPGDIEWAVRLGIGVPVAQGSTDFTNPGDPNGFAAGRLQTVADAANGWHDPELYAVKRLPISPALQFTDRADKLRLNAELKVVVMPKLGGSFETPAVPGGGTYSLNGMAFTTILGGSASYELFNHFYGALAAWLTYVPVPAIDYSSAATAPSPFQFVVEPRLLARFGKIVPSVGFVLPLGGQLGGNIYGIRVHIDAVF